EDAEIRLIVGRINLVEKIADLARRRGIPPPQPETPAAAALRREGAAMAFDRAEEARDAASGEREIVKEGLSEYFMFTVEGRESVPNGWSKRMRAVAAEGQAFDILYRLRPHQYGERPVRFFIWKNDEEHGLGESPLPDGRVRLFRENGRDGLSFLGEQLIRYVPIQAPIEVNLGPDDLVIYERRAVATERYNFHFRTSGRTEVVDGWDERTAWIDTIRNYRTKAIRFELRRQWPGHVDYGSEVATSLFDFQTIEATFAVDARGPVPYPYTVVRHLGTNAKQQRIDLR
ncbi:MAG: hypothetical protein ACYTG6_10565, partial [Planctomycetota bacterium]